MGPWGREMPFEGFRPKRWGAVARGPLLGLKSGLSPPRDEILGLKSWLAPPRGLFLGLKEGLVQMGASRGRESGEAARFRLPLLCQKMPACDGRSGIYLLTSRKRG